MKLSVSLPAEDVEFVDAYSAKMGLASRSSVIHKAISLLREESLQEAYAEAFEEWCDDEAEVWEATAQDGLSIETTR